MRGTENDDNGLLGYNCRHRLIPYFKGSTPPKDFTKEQIKKEYEIDQKQHYFERQIRNAKQDAFLLKGIDGKQSQASFAKARELESEYKEYSKANNRTAYIYRTQIMREEIPVLKELKNNSKDDIIKLVSKMPLRQYENLNISEEKIFNYALNFDREPNKATAFQEALGYTKENGTKLIDNIRENIKYFDAKEKADNGYGERYEVIMKITGENGKTANVKTAWIIDNKTKETRLTSLYVTKKKLERKG